MPPQSTYNVPGQNLSFPIPNQGQVWRDANDPTGGSVYARVGDSIQSLSLRDLGMGSNPQSFTGSSKDAIAAGQQILKDTHGIDFSTIPTGNFNQADLQSAHNLTMGGSLTPETLKGMLGNSGVQTAENVTQGVHPTNPNAYTLNSSLRGDISPKDTPATGQPGALNPGANPVNPNPGMP